MCSLIRWCEYSMQLFLLHHLHMWDLQWRHLSLPKSRGSESHSLCPPLAEVLFHVSSWFSCMSSVPFPITLCCFWVRMTKRNSIWCLGTPHRPALFCTSFKSFLSSPWWAGYFLAPAGFKTNEEMEMVVSCLGSAYAQFLLDQECKAVRIPLLWVPGSLEKLSIHDYLQGTELESGVRGSALSLSIVIPFIWGLAGLVHTGLVEELTLQPPQWGEGWERHVHQWAQKRTVFWATLHQ